MSWGTDMQQQHFVIQSDRCLQTICESEAAWKENLQWTAKCILFKKEILIYTFGRVPSSQTFIPDTFRVIWQTCTGNCRPKFLTPKVGHVNSRGENMNEMHDARIMSMQRSCCRRLHKLSYLASNFQDWIQVLCSWGFAGRDPRAGYVRLLVTVSCLT